VFEQFRAEAEEIEKRAAAAKKKRSFSGRRKKNNKRGGGEKESNPPTVPGLDLTKLVGDEKGEGEDSEASEPKGNESSDEEKQEGNLGGGDEKKNSSTAAAGDIKGHAARPGLRVLALAYSRNGKRLATTGLTLVLPIFNSLVWHSFSLPFFAKAPQPERLNDSTGNRSHNNML
jgi:hypothetical protein